MNWREDPNDPIGGVPDINLNGQTVVRGAMIAKDIKYAQSLADWIREVLCVE